MVLVVEVKTEYLLKEVEFPKQGQKGVDSNVLLGMGHVVAESVGASDDQLSLPLFHLATRQALLTMALHL